jgi:hypothetical protein
MDAILDSNVFLSDLNFQGTQFAELFAYLKRTGDALVLPTMVMQETSARYKERLTNALNKAKGTWVALGGIRSSSHPAFPTIDLDKEIEGYRNRLIRAAPGVRVLQYADVSGVDANEIARRGSQRVRPANPNGEELRDVLLWLLLFQYANQTKRDVAFISGDKGFREPDTEDRLHPDLAAEIAESKLPIHFFPHIGSFVTSQSLSHEKVDGAWAQKYLQSEDVEHRIVMEMDKVRTKYGFPELIGFLMNPLEFVEGIIYKIAPESDYAELKYKGKARLTFDEWQTFSLHLDSLHIDKAAVRDWLTVKAADTPYTIASDVADYFIRDENAKTVKAIQPSKVNKFFSFDASISVRIEKEKLVSWQVDEVRLTETDDVPDALKRLP